MAQHVLDLLKERGFIAQMTFEDELYEQLKNPTTFYVGFDPTADSLHIGHYIPIMAMAHMQRAGHRPIALMGGGTAMIGDPSGKTDMRKMMTVETIPAVTVCEDCGQQYPTVQFGRTCPHCGSEKTWLKQGREINLKEIEAI